MTDLEYLKRYYSNSFTSGFGDCRPANGNPCGRRHRGVDLSHSTRSGTIAVPALFSGVVVGHTWPGDGSGFGHGIKIKSVLGDGNEWVIHYAHGPWASGQKVGEWVDQGQIVLHEGLSGFTNGPCVHIEQMRVKDGFFTSARGEMDRVARGQGDYNKSTPAAPAPAGQPAPQAGSKPNVKATLASLNWRGIAAMLRGTGRYSGNNTPGPVMYKAFQSFLNDAVGAGLERDGDPGDATAKAMQLWLKRKWGYGGAIDAWIAGGTITAWNKAENANWLAYPAHQQWP